MYINQFVKTTFPCIKGVPFLWGSIVDHLSNYRPKLYIMAITLTPAKGGWVTCNTNGASRGIPGVNAYNYCIRNECGNLFYAKA